MIGVEVQRGTEDACRKRSRRGNSKSEDLSKPEVDCLHRNGRKHSEMEISSLKRFYLLLYNSAVTFCMKIVTAEVFISCKCMQHSSLELSCLPLVKHVRSDVQYNTDLFVIILSFYGKDRFVSDLGLLIFWVSIDADACAVF